MSENKDIKLSTPKEANGSYDAGVLSGLISLTPEKSQWMNPFRGLKDYASCLDSSNISIENAGDILIHNHNYGLFLLDEKL